MELLWILGQHGNLKRDTRLYITFEEEKQSIGSLPMTVRLAGRPLYNLVLHVTTDEFGVITATLRQSEDE